MSLDDNAERLRMCLAEGGWPGDPRADVYVWSGEVHVWLGAVDDGTYPNEWAPVLHRAFQLSGCDTPSFPEFLANAEAS